MGIKVNLWNGRVLFNCPGCNETHMFIVDGTRGWTWNSNLEAPTASPSILLQGKKLTAKGKADIEAWRIAGCEKLPDGYEFENTPSICHSFINDGRIQFLSDCTHALAGKTVDLPDWEE